MRRRSLDLAIVSVLALITIIVAWVGPKNLNQINSLPLIFAPLGILMTLIIPGYALVVGLFPQLDGLGILVLSLGVSLAMDIIGGIVLNYTPLGLQPLSWSILLAIITWGGSLNATFRRRSKMPQETEAAKFAPRLTWRVALLFIITAVIFTAAVGVTLAKSSLYVNSFTQLWALPINDNGLYSLKIGIHNYEGREVHYNLYVEEKGARFFEQTDIVVAPNQKWVTSVDLLGHPEALVKVYLYLTENPKETYRTVQIAPVSFDAVITPTPTSPNP